ncbi:MAG TPA: isoamylase early set domain-containing protein [Gemmatimonadales bacterium]|nr:isoamylase early set domain-containing protein [Gemmatimonadales bacterium]
MTTGYHPLIKRMLDGEISLGDLPPERRAEGDDARRLLASIDTGDVTLSTHVENRVMSAVRRRARSPLARAWSAFLATRVLEVHVRLGPWALAAAACLALVGVGLSRRGHEAPVGSVAEAPVYVRFVCYAPGAHRVALVGTFNRWDPEATPLAPSATPGVWAITVALPAGQHQYAFLLDGARWATDPSAPAVSDGFGQRNSVVTVTNTPAGARAL